MYASAASYITVMLEVFTVMSRNSFGEVILVFIRCTPNMCKKGSLPFKLGVLTRMQFSALIIPFVLYWTDSILGSISKATTSDIVSTTLSRCYGSLEYHSTHTQILWNSFISMKHFSRISKNQLTEYSLCLSTITTTGFFSMGIIPCHKDESRFYVSVLPTSPPYSLLNDWPI